MEFPADMFLSPPGNAVEVHPETVEYAKKLLDELSASKPPAKQNKPVPPVPRFNPQVVAEMLVGAGGRCFGERIYLLEICRPEKKNSYEVYVVNSPSSS